MTTESPRRTLRKAIVAAIDSGSLKQLLAEGTPSRDFEALVRADTDYDKRKSLFTWALRGVGTLMMYIGFFVFLSPLSNMTSVIPILGTIARGTAAFTAIVIAVPLSMVVIALAWLPYRPILGGGLILLAVAVGYALWRWAKTRSSHVPPPTPAHAS